MKNRLKTFNVDTEKEAQSPYDPAFVVKIKNSHKQVEEGKTVTYSETNGQ